eukprot:CAMPEP_0202854196 /NCGR_PEP_ID=MMETSP1389-20130828/90877_1 /ASSEMBLY_ACC=CAM_ASM_000865 /TAXON_ID=302021 /ORGANISM="Rhodomonas sp., Strain CCMP768" /LENGTH=327 /DNA_ID=CAMNT_0049532777 /DNA_START=132 /DNA_END=1112 /DNA_ORIENTATION=-
MPTQLQYDQGSNGFGLQGSSTPRQKPDTRLPIKSVVNQYDSSGVNSPSTPRVVPESPRVSRVLNSSTASSHAASVMTPRNHSHAASSSRAITSDPMTPRGAQPSHIASNARSFSTGLGPSSSSAAPSQIPPAPEIKRVLNENLQLRQTIAMHEGKEASLQKDMVQPLQKRLEDAEAHIAKLEKELQVYDGAMDRALIRLGIEDGMRGLDSEGAAAELAAGIGILLDSETHLLAQAETLHEEILELKEQEKALLRRLDLPQPPPADPPPAQRPQVQEEELQQLYSYSTQLLAKMTEVQEENAELRGKEAEARRHHASLHATHNAALTH